MPAREAATVEPVFYESTATTPAQSTIETPAAKTISTQYTTQNNLSGNHVVGGSMDIQTASVIDIPLDGVPIWLVTAPLSDSAIFVAVVENGSVQAFKVTRQSYSPIEITPAQLPAGMPPLLMVLNSEPQLIIPPADASPLANPILLDDGLVYIASSGDLVVNDVRLPVNALPDSRILMDENNRLLVLSQPTKRYDHGALGDDLEASGITLVETESEIRVIRTITIEEPDVIEGVSAIWADMDNDANRDIIVTLSNHQNGARLAAFNEDGTLLAESNPIGLGYRWRHQIAVAQFEPSKLPLLVSIRTPHIGGIVEFLQYSNGMLEIVNEIKGFSTHSIGSRNLDASIAADFNNDGIIELLAPDQPHTSLGVISIDGTIAILPLDGVLTSNLVAVEVNGQIIIGAGTPDKLRIWSP